MKKLLIPAALYVAVAVHAVAGAHRVPAPPPGENAIVEASAGLERLVAQHKATAQAAAPAPAPSGAAAFELRGIAARLAKGPLAFLCSQTLVDAPGGLDVLSLEIVAVATGELRFGSVRHGYDSGRPGSATEWAHLLACDTVNTVSLDARLDQLDGTCQGAVRGIADDHVDPLSRRVYVATDPKTHIVLAKLVYPGRGHPDEISSLLICQVQ